MFASVLENALVLYARRFPIRRGKLRVIDSLWETALQDQCTQRVATLKHGRFRIPCDIREMLQRQFYFFGTYFLEEDILGCWEDAAKGAKVVIDVGANAGIYSLAALAVQPDAVVHAFEPTPEIAERLRAAARENGLDRLCVHEAAVANRNGTAVLKRFRGELGTNEGMNFIVQDPANSGDESVQTVSLDQFCETNLIDHVDLLKLDVQGHEHTVLKGAEHLIKAGGIGTIFMELNWARKAEAPCGATESVRLLGEAGYLFSKPGKCLTWRKSGEWMRGLGDVVARRAHS
jgi:FkbM family methyltransferase